MTQRREVETRMKMITLFLPEKYLEMLDALVAENL